MKTPWKTDKWYTSPWNFLDEARKGHKFAPKIKLHDVSLRDGEQQAGLIFNKDQKIAIAKTGGGWSSPDRSRNASSIKTGRRSNKKL